MLTEEGCRLRQQRLLHALERAEIEAALIAAPRDIYYLTGLLPESKFPYPNLLYLGPGERSWLITGSTAGEPVVDEVVRYSINELFTLNPDNHRRVAELAAALAHRRQGLARMGYQREELPHSLFLAVDRAGWPRAWVEIDEILQDLQLRKDPDEVECLRRAVHANLSAYTRAQQVLGPGVNELEVLGQCQAAAARAVSEPIYHHGDYRGGAFGGPARDRPLEPGELYIIDAWSDVDGYWCDMARTWAVGGSPTDLQQSVFDHLAGILKAIPRMARAGGSTTGLWHEIDAAMREHPHLADIGLTHHAGHGVGVRVHEGPDLNRDRGGTFEPGNVFTCEPGAYTSALRGGVRLENVFHVTPAGIETLSDYPLTLVQDPECPYPSGPSGRDA